MCVCVCVAYLPLKNRSMLDFNMLILLKNANNQNGCMMGTQHMLDLPDVVFKKTFKQVQTQNSRA